MNQLSLEEKIELLEMAAESVDTYEDDRIYSYRIRVQMLLDSLSTSAEACSDPARCITRLEQVLKVLDRKIQKKQNYNQVRGQLDGNP